MLFEYKYLLQTIYGFLGMNDIIKQNIFNKTFLKIR